MPLGLPALAIPISLVSGKRFTSTWDIFSESGIDDPSEVTAAELRLKRVGLPAVGGLIWSIATGEMEFVTGEDIPPCLAVDVDDTVTTAMLAGRWEFLLSIGLDGAPPELPVHSGFVVVTEEP